MKTINYNKYGSQDEMYWADLVIPKPITNQILVNVKAISLNPIDWKIRKGEMKLFINKKFPKGIGTDFSGIVENVGSKLSKFKEGDEVFGWLPYKMAGSVSEFVIADEGLTVKKPANMSFAEASTLPMACIASITALVDGGKIKKGMNVLINGCTGGVGQFAVMIAKTHGAIVTGTCNTSSNESAKQIGVDHIIDYSKVNVLKGNKKFDIIFDTVGNLKLGESKIIMNSYSIFLELNPNPINLIFGSVKNIFTGKKVKSIIAKASPEKMETIKKLATEGKLNPIISKEYIFDNALEAYKNLENGEKNIGKTVIINYEKK
ncbi:MAG: NAD(P)-dependent alcohol dehydrogenase [Bacteroidetes bacterium]|nr:NAD(P)-dependent alcohol dehydrogenase [Bacteroidota bacterium]